MKRRKKIEITPEEKVVVTKFVELFSNYCDKVTDCEKCPFDEFCIPMKSTLNFMAIKGGVYLE